VQFVTQVPPAYKAYPLIQEIQVVESIQFAQGEAQFLHYPFATSLYYPAEQFATHSFPDKAKPS
jgi:hypothetical protein